MDFEKLLHENHGKEIIIYTKDDHHYQGKLVGCQCRSNTPFQCSHLIMLLMDVNYVDISVENIADVKVFQESEIHK